MVERKLFLAIYLSSKDSPRMKAWNALPEADRSATMQRGIAAWRAWAERHGDAIVELGGPLGKTLAVDERGVHEISNRMSAFTLVRADSHAAAAKLFEQHPHCTIFPGDSIEVMPVLPIPGA